ncbi:toprim domain-containing protein, partial [Arthrobacter mobilis]
LVVVEGYTDVMACHLSGVTTAVATCGTAFGADHIKVARRLLSDDGTGGEVVFTFDGDEAGQKAALRAFEEDQRFIAQTFVAVEPTGADPCDLRMSRGPEAVRGLIAARRPLFEFAIKATLKKFDLNTVEGRVSALRASAPVVARIRDAAMRPAYARELAGWLGMDVDEVLRAVLAAGKREAGRSRGEAAGEDRRGSGRGSTEQHGAGEVPAVPAPAFTRPDLRDPAVRMERQALEVALQQPALLDADQWQRFAAARFSAPAHAAVHAAIGAAGLSGATASQWVERVRQEVPEELRSFVSELAVTPLPARDGDALHLYCRGIMNRMFDLQITELKAEKMGRLQRMDPAADPEAFAQINRELMELEMQRRALRGD